MFDACQDTELHLPALTRTRSSAFDAARLNPISVAVFALLFWTMLAVGATIVV